MKTNILIAMIILMAVWSCQKEKEVQPDDTLLSLSGTIQKIDYCTVYQYGSHTLETGDSVFALWSSTIDLDQYLSESVTVSAKKINGYPVDFGPVFLEVYSINKR